VAVTSASTASAIRHRTLYERYGKRPFDLVVAAFLAVALAPLIAAVALGVRLTMGKGVLFRQERLGRDAEPFEIVKFRSMKACRRLESVPWDGQERRQTHKTEADPRHTVYGRFIRKYSLDELPQLINILRGEMSLVGPRPELPAVAERCGIVDHPRHDVLPGLTGPWQLGGDRQGLIADNIHLDEQYLERITFRGDMAYLIRTPVMMLGPRGSRGS
jgi:lipopolysaccharide/colanic/teichoic acid biosynthesis glycosyltransferase